MNKPGTGGGNTATELRIVVWQFVRIMVQLETVSRARGEAQAIINRANAEARSVQEIARVVSASGEDPTSYLLAVKYIDVFGKILLYQNTSVEFLPAQAAFLLTSKGLGLSTIAGNRARQ